MLYLEMMNDGQGASRVNGRHEKTLEVDLGGDLGVLPRGNDPRLPRHSVQVDREIEDGRPCGGGGA